MLYEVIVLGPLSLFLMFGTPFDVPEPVDAPAPCECPRAPCHLRPRGYRPRPGRVLFVLRRPRPGAWWAGFG